MTRFNKVLSLKLICVLLMEIFLCNAALSSCPDSEGMLRLPLDTKRLEGLQKETNNPQRKSPEELRLDKERIATLIALKTTDHSGTMFDVRKMLGPVAVFLELLGDEDYLDDGTDIKIVMMKLAKEIRTEIAKHRELTLSAQEYGYEDVLNIPEGVIREWQGELSRLATRFREFKDRFDNELYVLLLARVKGEEEYKELLELTRVRFTKVSEAQENRAEGALLRSQKEVSDLDKIVKEIALERLKELNSTSDRKANPLNVEFVLHQQLPDVMLNRLSIEAAIANIVQNASEEKLGITKLAIAMRFFGNEVFIEIWDNGPGFPEEFLVQKKGKLYQEAFEFGVTKRDGGTGFGLAETRWYIMEEHGGSIRVSNPLDKIGGSKITITLPITNQPSIESTLSVINPKTDI